MAVLVPNLAAPHKVVYIPFGMTSTPAGTAPVSSAIYRMWMTTETTEILSIQLVRTTGAQDAGLTYQAGSIAATAAVGALTVMASTAVADPVAVGLVTVPVDADANDASKGPVFPPATVIGFTAIGTASTARLQGMVIRYRSS
jgi:hypothetical protein